jgi:hypothetical protein
MAASSLDLLPPVAQVRAVQSLTTQQRPNGTRIAAGIGFAHDAPLVAGREFTAARNGDNLGAHAFVNLFYRWRHLVFHVIATSLISMMKLSHSSLTQGGMQKPGRRRPLTATVNIISMR